MINPNSGRLLPQHVYQHRRFSTSGKKPWNGLLETIQNGANVASFKESIIYTYVTKALIIDIIVFTSFIVQHCTPPRVIYQTTLGP